ncbi:DUF3094 family protein [Halopseudomonas pertucinogena]|uniref:DUF3094 family protein n=1 Tax=Halopseudomonas pertucinogena TaxID=86175 RepID=A0ABQ2CPU9_9GAMM|nr:DUF3094 family protein [Halopseudomonas pertucinogena]GGJ01589.1 hypothetical protein GCM10009083_17970 [Halopseudomonas pertucinogena]
MASRLYPEDQKRVDEYLDLPQNRVNRKPFKVWWLLAALVMAVVGLGLFSRYLASLVIG